MATSTSKTPTDTKQGYVGLANEFENPPSKSTFGSDAIPTHVAKNREPIIPPDTNEVRAENERSKLPTINGWRVLIVPYSQPRQTRGGIYVPDEVVRKEQLATVIGYVVSVGPIAYKDERKFGKDAQPWCKPGDYVIFGRYAGARLTMRGENEGVDDLACRILNDDEILGTVPDPADYVGVS
jgi:co-chaperonin GroES (HSP10)